MWTDQQYTLYWKWIDGSALLLGSHNLIPNTCYVWAMLLPAAKMRSHLNSFLELVQCHTNTKSTGTIPTACTVLCYMSLRRAMLVLGNSLRPGEAYRCKRERDNFWFINGYGGAKSLSEPTAMCQLVAKQNNSEKMDLSHFFSIICI